MLSRYKSGVNFKTGSFGPKQTDNFYFNVIKSLID
ncbi:hypothetical protein HDF26_001936 [Pedobacter cryoconitis]|uniref:Uncharacterized protein n=1 Tax=Pedobacter cryoconitis TaxID=188932 RepID=A0A7W8ZM60_9SPHI|nr:hypothetical protein [Pedobacter cryoconitis]MBB6271509.1 hypothetical protein [Pedobacter cryoconitis]